MKGMGTFRRTVSAAVALLGAVGKMNAPEPTRIIGVPSLREERERKRRKHRYKKNRHTAPRRGWPILYWGDCPKPVSRKVLKKIASTHFALTR